MPETRKVFEQGVTGPLRGQVHRGGEEHNTCNDAVDELFARYKAEQNIRSENMAPNHAREFIDVVKRSRDPRIRTLNLRTYVREIMNAIRLRYLRGNEE